MVNFYVYSVVKYYIYITYISMMAEVKVTAPDLNKCDHDDNSNSTLKKTANFEMDQQLPNHEEASLLPSESKIKIDYLENLLDIPDVNVKENFKEKLGPQLQETQPNLLNNISDLIVAGTSSKNVNRHNQIHEDSTLNKIQNVESSVTSSSSVRSSTIATDTVNTENMASGYSLNYGRVQQNMQSLHNQDCNNASDLFTSTTDTTYQNNQKQMNNSLKLICDYGSDSDVDDIIEMGSMPEAIIIGPSENEKSFLNDYRTAQVLFSEDSDDDSDSSDEKSDSDSSTSSSNSSSSSSSSSSSVNAENASAVRRVVNAQNNTPRPMKKDALKTRGEILIEDLPPIQDLQINVPAEECIQLGKISSIVDQLVVVQALKNTPPLDLDSVLFLDHGRQTLGRIFDVFGPVSEPLYCVRFNSADHIKEKGLEKDMAVYCAPKTQHTSYVFVPDLLRIKGSDASWEDNNEPPPKFADYSDDEEERRARRSLKLEERKVTDEGPEQPKKKKNRSNSFERRMNERNLRMTALHANKPAAAAVRNGNNNNNNNSNSNPFQPFDNSTWWTCPIPPSPRFQHCLSRPPPPPCTPSPPRLIQPPTFTLPPPTAPPFFPSIQPPFLPYNYVFPPSVPPFDPNRPPPSFGFPPPMPPQMPQHHPPL